MTFRSSAEVTLKRIGLMIKNGLQEMKNKKTISTEVKIHVCEEAWIFVSLVLKDYVKARYVKKGERRKGEVWYVEAAAQLERCKVVFGENFYFFLERLSGNGEGGGRKQRSESHIMVIFFFFHY